MKKVFLVFISAILVFVFVSCGETSNNDKQGNQQQSYAESITSESKDNNQEKSSSEALKETDASSIESIAEVETPAPEEMLSVEEAEVTPEESSLDDFDLLSMLVGRSLANLKKGLPEADANAMQTLIDSEKLCGISGTINVTDYNGIICYVSWEADYDEDNYNLILSEIDDKYGLSTANGSVNNGEGYMWLNYALDGFSAVSIMKYGNYIRLVYCDDALKDASPSNYQDSSDSNLNNSGALTVAINYISHIPMSYEGLVDQLEYEGFSHEEATYAADNCGADWTEQAELRAASYIEKMGMSYNGLIEQLEYDGFSHSDAKNAADNCGADWNQEALQKAQSYRLHNPDMTDSKVLD